MTTDLFGRRPFAAVVRDVRERLGRCPRDALVQGVRQTITLDEYEEWARAAFNSAVVRASKSRILDKGGAAVIGVADEVSPVEQLTFDELVDKAYAIARQHNSLRLVVYAIDEIAVNEYGQSIEPDRILAETDEVA